MFEERIKPLLQHLVKVCWGEEESNRRNKTTRKVLDRFKKFSLFDQTLGACSLEGSSLKKQHQAKLFVWRENILNI